MLPKERKQQIVNIVNDRRGCTVEELAEVINVSETTIRRDLQDLEERKLVERTYGGAMPTVNQGKPYDNRKIHNIDQKVAIGERAADEIHQDQIVILDGGTTPIEVAKQVSSEISFTPVTPMPLIARELAEMNLEVHLIGGIYDPENYSVTGPWAHKFIQRINADLLVIGADGIDETGLTTRDIQQYRLKELMVEHSNRVVLVADHSKFGNSHPFYYSDYSSIDLFITDETIPSQIREQFEANDVELVENVYS